MAETIIIGVSGKKQSGKSTAVEHLRRRYAGMEPKVRSFAAPLKRIVVDFFTPRAWELTVEDLDREEIKERVTPCGKTIRELLQVIGTDWFRATYPDVWINAMDHELEFVDGLVLVPDVRFPNEVQFIQERGGHVIRLMRAPLQDGHESEMALDGVGMRPSGVYVGPTEESPRERPKRDEHGFDAVINNRDMTIQVQGRVVDQVMDICGWVPLDPGVH